MFESLLTLIAPFMVALSLTGVTGTTESSCVPPVPPKPQSAVQSNDFGTMTITPEISEAHAATSGTRREKDGIKESEITIAVVPNVNARTIIITDGPFFSYTDLIDWGPQDKKKLVDFTYNSSNGSLIFSRPQNWWESVGGIRKPMPAHQSYWVKLRVSPTVPENSQNNTGSYGWNDIRYLIEKDNKQWGSGTGLYFVNGPQAPGVRIGRIGNQILPRTKQRWFFKPVVVKPNKTFELEVEALGQGGVVSIPSDNRGPGILGAEIIGPQTLVVKANETAVFNMKPSGNSVSIQNVEIRNSCGSSSATIGESEIRIQSDLEPQAKIPVIKPIPPLSPPKAPSPTPPPVVKSRPTVTPTPLPRTTPPSKPPQTSGTATVKYIAIAPGRSLEGLVEGDTVTFTAVLVMSDGTQTPAGATDKITWSVIGDIGTISANGVFKAKLDPSILEIGEGIGTVTALYVDTQGNPSLAKTQTFKVKALFLDDGATQG